MSNALTSLSEAIAAAAERAGASVVQVHGHHRPAAGIVVADNLIIAPARAVPGDTASVRLPDGSTVEGAVLGHGVAAGMAAVRVDNLPIKPLAIGGEPRVGHLAIAVGRTWSGALMTTVTTIAVIGGPLRTGRTSQLERVIRIAQPPHGALVGGALVDGDGQALGTITGSEIRGTTIVIPASIAWPIAQQIAQQGGTRQGFVGIGSSAVPLPARQRAGRSQEYGLLVNAVVDQSPADAAGLLVGDVIVAFDGRVVEDPEVLVTLLRGDRVGRSVPLTVLRGGEARDIAVTVGERPRRDRHGQR